MAFDPSDASTRALVLRLWRQYVSRHKAGIAMAIFCTLAVAGLTALYPVVIQQASDLFTRGDARPGPARRAGKAHSCDCCHRITEFL